MKNNVTDTLLSYTPAVPLTTTRNRNWTDRTGNPIQVKDLTDAYLLESYVNTSSDVLLREMVYRLFEEKVNPRVSKPSC